MQQKCFCWGLFFHYFLATLVTNVGIHQVRILVFDKYQKYNLPFSSTSITFMNQPVATATAPPRARHVKSKKRKCKKLPSFALLICAFCLWWAFLAQWLRRGMYMAIPRWLQLLGSCWADLLNGLIYNLSHSSETWINVCDMHQEFFQTLDSHYIYICEL